MVGRVFNSILFNIFPLVIFMAKTIVLKLGSSSICTPELRVRINILSQIIDTISTLQSLNYNVILVSSGAIALGLRQLKIPSKPTKLSCIQAIASIGQGHLIQLYNHLFSLVNINSAQILLTRDNLSSRSQYLNAKATFNELMMMNIVAIVNENDAVCNQEIRFGDNDTLSALTAGLFF